MACDIIAVAVRMVSLESYSPPVYGEKNLLEKQMISLKSYGLMAAVIACLFLLVPTISAQAKENAEYWPKTRVGGKLCFRSHEHYGESPPWPSKGGAKAAAIRKWENFTSWEYGKRWGRYASATGRRLSCSKAKGSWVCKTSARPCRRG